MRDGEERRRLYQRGRHAALSARDQVLAHQGRRPQSPPAQEVGHEYRRIRPAAARGLRVGRGVSARRAGCGGGWSVGAPAATPVRRRCTPAFTPTASTNKSPAETELMTAERCRVGGPVPRIGAITELQRRLPHRRTGRFSMTSKHPANTHKINIVATCADPPVRASWWWPKRPGTATLRGG